MEGTDLSQSPHFTDEQMEAQREVPLTQVLYLM